MNVAEKRLQSQIVRQDFEGFFEFVRNVTFSDLALGDDVML